MGNGNVLAVRTYSEKELSDKRIRSAFTLGFDAERSNVKAKLGKDATPQEKRAHKEGRAHGKRRHWRDAAHALDAWLETEKFWAGSAAHCVRETAEKNS